jgi:hypothetical protein
MPRPSRYPIILSVGIDPDLDARLAEAARTSGQSKAEIVRQWLRRGGWVDQPGIAPGADVDALLKEAAARAAAAWITLSKPGEGNTRPPW